MNEFYEQYPTQPAPDRLAYMRQQTMNQRPYMPNQRQYQQVPGSGINWVQGEAGAKAFRVAPGNTEILMDCESNTFFLKTVDFNGIPEPLRVFDYSERIGQKSGEEYLTRKEFLLFVDKLQGSDHEPKYAKED